MSALATSEKKYAKQTMSGLEGRSRLNCSALRLPILTRSASRGCALLELWSSNQCVPPGVMTAPTLQIVRALCLVTYTMRINLCDLAVTSTATLLDETLRVDSRLPTAPRSTYSCRVNPHSAVTSRGRYKPCSSAYFPLSPPRCCWARAVRRRRRRPAPPPQRAMAPSPMPPATVYFASGSATLSQESMATIQQVAANYRSAGNATVTLTGHTDTVGSQDFNMALSQRRADAVRNALVRAGVPAAAITAGGQGEASLPVQTADNVDERRNRSVDIAVVGPIPVARTGMTDAEYCAALSRTYPQLPPLAG